jgi:hypothetical protein
MWAKEKVMCREIPRLDLLTFLGGKARAGKRIFTNPAPQTEIETKTSTRMATK